MNPDTTTSARRAAFTLIELLVVIAVIGLLISIALPVMGNARKSAAKVRESAAIRQAGIAYTVYSQDSRGALMPGFLPLSWVDPAGDPSIDFNVFHGETSAGTQIYGSVARRFPWRLAPYLGYAMDALVVDKRLRAEFAALPDRPDTRDGFQWAIANSPSFGMNTTYVGGDERRGAFYAPAVARWGRYYVTRIDEPRLPDRLLIFATSRGDHPINGSPVIPGRHRIEGPWRASRELGQVPTFSPWEAPAGPFNASKSPTTYGHLDFRHFRKAIVVMFDGHVESADLDALRDMRRWSNQATSPDWHP